MREKFEEATATIEQLRRVAAVTAEATLTDLMAGGFMGSMNLEKRLELHDKVIQSLKDIGASQEQIDQAEADWKKGIGIIYHRAIRRVVEQRKHPNTINPDAPESAKKAGREIEELLDFQMWNAPSPDQVRAVLQRNKIKSDEADAWVSDYEHFLKTNEIRNRQQFFKQ